MAVKFCGVSGTNITVTILTPMAVKFCGVSGTNITVTILTPMAVKFCGVCGPILLSRSSLQWQSNFVEYVDQYYCHDPHSNGSQILWSMWTNITVTILTPMAVKFCGVCGPILLSRSSLQWQSNFVEYVDQYYCHDPHSNGSKILWSMWDQYYCHDPHSNGSKILWSMWTNITAMMLTPMAVKFCGVCGTNITVTILTPMAVKFCGVSGTNMTVTMLTPMAVKFCGVCGTNITVTILTPMAVKFCGVCGPILLSRSSLQWQSNFVEYVDQYYCHDPHSNGSQIM